MNSPQRTDFGAGSKRYSDATLRKYILKIRWNREFYAHVMERMAELETRYQKILESRRNKISV